MKESTKTKLHSLLYLKKEEILKNLDHVAFTISNQIKYQDYITDKAILDLKALIEVDELINKLERF